jgi:outer membrane protein assembly factor BamB
LTSAQLTHCEWCFLELTVTETVATESGASEPVAAEPEQEQIPLKTPQVTSTSASGTGTASRVAWTFSVTADRIARQPLRNCPAVDDQGRIVACIQDELVMLQETDQGQVSVLWQLPTGGFIPGSPTIGNDGLIRVHSLGGQVFFVRDNGELAREPVRVGEPLGWATPLVDNEGNTWISAYAGGLIKVDSAGQTASRPFYMCASKLDSVGVIRDKTLFIGSNDQCVHAIDLSQSRGTRRWDNLAGRGRTNWYINTPLILLDGLVIATSLDKHLYAFDQNGFEVWKYPLPGQVLGSPVAHANRLYFGASIGEGDLRAGCLTCLDTQTRQVVWTYKTADPIDSAPVIGNDGMVYFGDSAGLVHAVDSNGRAVWTEQLPAPVRSAGALMPGRVLFGSDDGTLTAFRCESTGLASGWPKHLGTARNGGTIPSET